MPEQLFEVTVNSASGPRRVELRTPRFADISSLLHDRGIVRDAERLARWLRPFTLDFISKLDGKELVYDELDQLLADPELVRGLLGAIRTRIDTYRERGKIFALCPGCRTWEPEISTTAYALTIAEPLPSSFDGPFFVVPTLGMSAMLAAPRARLNRAARIRFELPSRTFAGVLDQVTYWDNENTPPAWPDDGEDDEPFNDNSPLLWAGAGWRAAVRLSHAIDPKVSIDHIGRLPAYDFFFLELVHFVTAMAEVRPDTPGKLTCPTCSTVFVPIRDDFRASR